MAQRLGAAATVTAQEWQQQIDQLGQAAAAINDQEQLLDMRCTHYADLEEAQRALHEMQAQAAQHAVAQGGALGPAVDSLLQEEGVE
jgi:hypothetical protein